MGGGRFRWSGMDLIQKLADAPQELIHWVKGKTGALAYESGQLESMQGIGIRPGNISALQDRLKRIKISPGSCLHGNKNHPISSAEQALVRRIHEETAYHNRNNVTRTMAYWSIYRRCPELHWAFLAHMVSRNGGWTMTDLRGELLPYLLDEDQQGHIFGLLERANALIFHDAYPQLLLYTVSKQTSTPLFHLLTFLNISSFMRPVWELFWERGDSALLTEALVVNEQHYIEQRVVRHPAYRRLVLDTLFFHAQSLFQLNQVVFPYADQGKLRLAGLVLENFSDLSERIEVGKKLYAILFGIPVVHQGAKQFAEGNRHTGSRCDYWPHLFAPVRQNPPVPRGQLKEWLDGCNLRPGASPLYSPYLNNAWKNRPMEQPEPGDWYEADGGSCLRYFGSVQPPFSFEMTHEYCFGLNKIELAVLAGDIWK